MRSAAVAFIISIVTGTILTPLVVRRNPRTVSAWSHCCALSSRKIHGRPIPRLGGIAIVLAFYAPLTGLLLLHAGVNEIFLAERDHVVGLFAGGLAIALLGVYDDLRGSGAGRKFLVQFDVAGFMYWLGYRIEDIANPFGSELHLGWASLPFTLFWIVGVINAMNLIDGLDGLAGGVALVAVVTTFLISLQRGHPLMVLFSSALAGSILGFLFYNFNPATIFMGDTGSMFLGFVLSTSAIQTNQKSSTAVAVLIPGIALGLPIMDTLLAMARRALRGRPVFQADKEHIHHRLLARVSPTARPCWCSTASASSWAAWPSSSPTPTARSRPSCCSRSASSRSSPCGPSATCGSIACPTAPPTAARTRPCAPLRGPRTATPTGPHAR